MRLGLAVAMSSAFGFAQAENLGERLAAVARLQNWHGSLQELRLAERPVGEVVDAVSAQGHAFFAQPIWQRVRQELESRDDDLRTSWELEPDHRCRRAAVLGRVPSFVGYARRKHETATLAERADLEFLALHTSPRWFRSPRPSEGARRASRELLHRWAVEGQRRRGAEWMALLRAHDARFVCDALGRDRSVGPFVLSQALTCNESRVRARTVCVLRRSLQLPPHPAIETLLDHEPLPYVRAPRPRNDAAALAIARRLESGAAVQPTGYWPATLGLPARRRLARAWTERGMNPRMSTSNAVGTFPVIGGGRATERSRTASSCFAAAASLGAEPFLTLLGLALNVEDDETRLRILRGLAMSRIDVDSVARGTGAVVALLDHEDANTASVAAALADRMLLVRRDPTLWGRVRAIAEAAVRRQPSGLQLAPADQHWCGAGGNRMGWPANRDSQAVCTAAQLGAVRIADPLIAELVAELDRNGPLASEDDRDPIVRHRWLLLFCLQHLAPDLDETRARRLNRLLARFGRPSEWDGNNRTLRFAVDLYLALFASVPSDSLTAYDGILAADGARLALVNVLVDITRADPGRVASERVQRIPAGPGPRGSAQFRLGLSCPDFLSAEWRAGGERRAAAMHCLRNASPGRYEHVVAFVECGQLPRALVAAALPKEPRSLVELAELLPSDDDASEWAAVVAERITGAVAGDPEEDLASLQVLATCPDVAVRLAVVDRALNIGEAGAVLASGAVDGLLATVEPTALARIVRFALERGLPIPEHDLVSARLRAGTHWRHERIAEALDVREYGGDRLRTAPPPHPQAVALSWIDVDADRLRAMYGDNRPDTLIPLLAGTVPTARAALNLIALHDNWSWYLGKAVAELTLHEDAGLRRAAYQTLATRDPDLSVFALLVHECWLDSDPRVRMLALNH